MHSPSAHRALRPGQKLFANESNFRLAYMGIINQIWLTINHSGLFYTLKTVKSPFKVKHFVNFANFSVNFGLFLLRFFTVCQFFCFLPCPAHKAKASALRRPGRIADAFLSRSISPQQIWQRYSCYCPSSGYVCWHNDCLRIKRDHNGKTF